MGWQGQAGSAAAQNAVRRGWDGGGSRADPIPSLAGALQNGLERERGTGLLRLLC